MRVLLTLLVALPLHALVSPCGIPTVTPEETRAQIGDVLLFDGAQPQGMCGFEFSTSTPSVIAVDGYQKIAGGFRVFVRTLAPGEGVLVVHGFLPGATEYTRNAATIHVEYCVPSTSTLALLPSYTVSVNAPIRIYPEVKGSFGDLFWYIDGASAGIGPSLTFTPQRTGSYRIEVAGASWCGGSWATATLNVVAETPRLHSVRRR